MHQAASAQSAPAQSASAQSAPAQSAPDQAAPGQPSSAAAAHYVGRFRVDDQIGAGSTGVVYKAYDGRLERPVALKLLAAGVAKTTEYRERLLKEARAMAQLSHPNVAVIHEVGEHDGQLFIAIELLEGGTLHQWMRAGGHSLDAHLEMLMQAGRGLEAAHKQGLLHRDFKPDNVLIGRDGRARIVDFGLVRAIDDFSPQASVSPTGETENLANMMTATGMMVGTPAYMAPEQFLGQVNAASDQFAFCVVAFEALYGARPFRAEHIHELQDAVLSARITMPENAPAIPAIVSSVIFRGLSREPADRFPSMTELLAELERGLAPKQPVYDSAVPAAAAVSSIGPPKRSFVGPIVGVVALLLAAGAAAAVFFGGVLDSDDQRIASDDDNEDESKKKTKKKSDKKKTKKKSDEKKSKKTSAATKRASKKAQAALNAGDYKKCVDVTMKAKDLDFTLISAGVSCAYFAQDFDAVEKVCKRWRKDLDGEHMPITCEKPYVKLTRLSHASEFVECLDYAKTLPSGKTSRQFRLTCSGSIPDWDEYRSACRTMRAKEPKSPVADACKQALEAVGKQL